MSLDPNGPLTALPGVGPSLARTLAGAGLATIGDLLRYLPHRYEDRSNPRPLAALTEPDQVVTVFGRIVQLTPRRTRNRRMVIVEGLLDDGIAALPVVWFNQPYLATSLKPGTRVWLHGALRAGRGRWGLQLQSPEWEAEDPDGDPVHLGRIVPIYRRVGNLSGRRMRTLIARALGALGALDDPLEPWLPAELGLPALDRAVRQLHFPDPPGEPGQLEALSGRLAERTTPAHRRLAFDELLALAVVLERERARRVRQRAVACRITDELRETARAVLPFRLTAAQRRVLAEIVADLQRPSPMARLLQGDVGSGKTIVAALAALVAMESGAQVAMLAPTELLAQQHQGTLTRLLAAGGRAPALLVGSLPAAEKRRVRAALADGSTRFVVGTHALLEDDVVLPRLGFVVIDEQHRFGVAQRQALLDKGTAPHLLVMTATPIPRSLALSLYGDMDVSLLDELPPGRTPIRTVLRDEAARPRLAEFIRDEVAAGGQAYWVFPLVEESEALTLRAVSTHVRSVRAALPGISVGMVHGRVPAAEREATMAAFAAGEIRVLCATTVIEVGVDNPNASVMVIEHPDRFGLAQLHQLRGRVGRGRRRSLCVLLLGERPGAEALARLEAFAATTDGFAIAEQDFRLRGPGEFTGLRQWGRPEFRVAQLWRHREELEAARAVAAAAAARGELERLSRALAPAGVEDRRVPVG